MADVKKYEFKISNSRPFWSIDSIDKPYDITEYLTWTPITIQNVNFIDSFTISFIADLDNYTYLAITDTTVSTSNAATATKYYYIETTSKRLAKGFEFIGKLDIWATFCGKTMVDNTRFPQNNYPLFVNRFINNKRAVWDAYYSSSAYTLKDEMFDYSHFLPTTDPNGYSISTVATNGGYSVAKHNMLFISFFSKFNITFSSSSCFSTDPSYTWILSQTSPPSPNFTNSNYNNNGALYNRSALRMHSKYSSPLLGLLYQADNNSGTYRLVVCGLNECIIIIDNKPNINNNVYAGDYQWSGSINGTGNIGGVNTSKSYFIKLAGLNETVQAIKDAFPYIDNLPNTTGDNGTQGYWLNKIKGIFYLDFIDMLEIGNNKWHFTRIVSGQQNWLMGEFNLTEDQDIPDIANYKPYLLFRDFEPQESIPVTNRQKWRFTSISTDTNNALTSSAKPKYFIWNTYEFNNYGQVWGRLTPQTSMTETYTRNGDDVNYLKRYPLSRISVDNVCLNPAFPDYLNYGDNLIFPPANYYGSTGFFDTGKALIGFDGVSWVLSTAYNSKYLLTSSFTQESYPCNYEGYANYINSVRSQQAAALTTAKNNAIFNGTMSGLSGILSIITGGFAALGAAKGDSSLVGDSIGGIGGGIMQLIGGPTKAWMDYAAKERAIEAQNQDKRRTAQVNIVQAGNTKALGINNAKANWYNFVDPTLTTSYWWRITNLISCNFAVNAPNTLTDIHYYNSLVWKFGLQANFNIDAYTILEPYGDTNTTSNPFTYFEIQELPSEFILRLYPNLQKDYINAIKAVFSGGVRQWVKTKYPQYNSNDNIKITWR